VSPLPWPKFIIIIIITYIIKYNDYGGNGEEIEFYFNSDNNRARLRLI